MLTPVQKIVDQAPRGVVLQGCCEQRIYLWLLPIGVSMGLGLCAMKVDPSTCYSGPRPAYSPLLTYSYSNYLLCWSNSKLLLFDQFSKILKDLTSKTLADYNLRLSHDIASHKWWSMFRNLWPLHPAHVVILASHGMRLLQIDGQSLWIFPMPSELASGSSSTIDEDFGLGSLDDGGERNSLAFVDTIDSKFDTSPFITAWMAPSIGWVLTVFSA